MKTFERGDADIILANARRYREAPYVQTENIINYNRIKAAMAGDSAVILPNEKLLEDGVVLKPGDYTGAFFHGLDSLQAEKVEFQSPKVALRGVLAGDYSYFLWGEEPLKWKIKELNLEHIVLCEVNIPVSEIHIIGRDRDLIYDMDDVYLRLKQSGEIQRINDRWLHPERVAEETDPWVAYAIVALLLLALLLYGLYHTAKAHVRNATQGSDRLSSLMLKALGMGQFRVMVYDIRRDRFTSLYGLPLQGAEGVTLSQFIARIHPGEQEEFKQRMEALLNGRERKLVLRRRWNAGDDSSPQWLHLYGHALVELDSEGRPAFVVNAIQDVTRNEEDRREEKDLEKKYLRLCNMPFLAMSFYDSDGALTDLNDAMRQMCDITPENSVAVHYWTTVGLFDIQLLNNVYERGSNYSLQAGHHMLYPDMGIDRYIEYHVQPLFDADGTLINYFVTTIDRTQEREMYHRLRMMEREESVIQGRIDRQKDWLTYLLTNSDRYLIQSDIATRRIAFFRTLGREEYVHQMDDFCYNYVAPECREELRQMITGVPTSQPHSLVIRLEKQSEGQTGTVFRVTSTPVHDAQGCITGHRGIAADITYLEEARRKLEQETLLAADSVRQKSGFMASMTHELRTPLNAIMGFTGVLESQETLPERAEYVGIIQKSSDMLQRLINDIIEASAIKGNATTLKAADVDFAKAFSEVCLTLRQRVEHGGVEFITDYGREPLLLHIDMARVQQVMANFVTNAVKFTRQGHIRLGYRYERDGLYVYCEDTGIGIPKDKQALIFDRFVKLDEFVQGTGMGLAISKSIVEQMGGEIGVSSDGTPGCGSTFWFHIPCARMQQATTTAA